MRTGRLSEFRHGQSYFRTDPRIILNQLDVCSSAPNPSGSMPGTKEDVLRSKAEPPVNSPTRFNNHGVTSFPLLSMPCSILSRTACSTAAWTLSPSLLCSAGMGTAKSVASGSGKVRDASTESAGAPPGLVMKYVLRIRAAASAGLDTDHGLWSISSAYHCCGIPYSPVDQS